MDDDVSVSVRRVVTIVLCLGFIVLVVVLLTTNHNESTWIATVVAAVAAVASLIYDVARSGAETRGSVRVSKTGSATVDAGGTAVSGYLGRADAMPTSLDVSETGDARASGGGDAVAGVDHR